MNNHSHRIHDTHRYGLRHSLKHGISRSTDVSLVARHECVPDTARIAFPFSVVLVLVFSSERKLVCGSDEAGSEATVFAQDHSSSNSLSLQPRSTWQSRCVLRGCVGVGVMQHAYHLAQILRAQATRSQVSSRSVQPSPF